MNKNPSRRLEVFCTSTMVKRLSSLDFSIELESDITRLLRILKEVNYKPQISLEGTTSHGLAPVPPK
ncbi:hypothetical protein N9Y89_02345 [bacterium]|nr:hypothetical protein [bacterium]